MLSNTGGGNSDSSSGAAAGAAGDPECVPEARGDGRIDGGLALGSSDARVVTKDPSQGQGTAGISFVGVGVVCSPDEIQGNAGGAAEIVLGRDNAEIFTSGNITFNAEVFGAAHTASLGPSNTNLNDQTHQHQQSSSPRSNQLGSLEESVCSPVITPKARQYFKKKSRKLCRKKDRRQTGDRKRSSFDFGQHHYPRTNEDDETPTVARSLPNRGHSPTKAEVKRIQH